MWQHPSGKSSRKKRSICQISLEQAWEFRGRFCPDGYVEVCVNLGWRDVNPQKELSAMLDNIPVKSGNDANVAALGEMWRGGGMGFTDIVMVTLGTGVGGGIIIDEKIIAGENTDWAEKSAIFISAMKSGNTVTAAEWAAWSRLPAPPALPESKTPHGGKRLRPSFASMGMM